MRAVVTIAMWQRARRLDLCDADGNGHRDSSLADALNGNQRYRIYIRDR